MGQIDQLMFRSIYSGRRVLITGGTGFKGSWLCAWLLKLGAKVASFALNVPTEPAMFNALSLGTRLRQTQGDIRNLEAVVAELRAFRPDFVFHLAAQAVVSTSYAEPVGTLSTNVLGTATVLEALRVVGLRGVAVLITSDKCYDNAEWPWGYRENDRLGGKDVYSASKGAAELVIRSYVESFFPAAIGIRIGIARAGNVIGGGDWSKDRIVADCIRAWTDNRSVEVRNPKATRPWQHVLEPLSGYLALGAALYLDEKLHGQAYNFGPKAEQNRTVAELLRALAKEWGFIDVESAFHPGNQTPFHEAGLLKLNCDKALLQLDWQPTLEFDETIRLVAEWYRRHHDGETDMYGVTQNQIELYETLATSRGRLWA